MPSMDPEVSSTSGELAAHSTSAVNSARVLLWTKQHGPLAALVLYVLYDGGILLNLVGTVC